MKVNRQYTTNKISKGQNTGDYIMLHHTWPWDEINLVKYLAYHPSPVSCHFVIWNEGEVYQLADLAAITWHAGDSKRQWLSWMNKYSIWIEIVSDWHTFTDKQRDSVRSLCNHLLNRLWLSYWSIIRHADVAGFRGKRDVGESFWSSEFASWEEYQNSYQSKPLSDEDRKRLDLLRKINSMMREMFPVKELRDSLHQTNNIVDWLLD
jgi:N-acetyl-anhydromuramyl-L-alanine amidase AmpD